MYNNQEHVRKLEQIKSILSHPAVEKLRVLHQVRTVFKEADYTKMPFNFEVPILHRAVGNTSEYWFDHVSKFGLAPADKAKLNRCNWAGHPMFYGSEDNAVPIFEIRAQKNDFVALSYWANIENQPGEFSTPIQLEGIALGVEKIVETLNDEDSFKDLLLLDDVFKPEISQAIKDIDRYIGDLFVESERENKNLYLFTSAVAKVFLENMSSGRDTLQGLIYPSVESNRTGTNIVLTEKFAKTRLRLHGVSLYKVISYDPDERRYVLKPIKSLTGFDHKGALEWKRVHHKYDGQHWEFTPDTPKSEPNEDSILDLEDDTE